MIRAENVRLQKVMDAFELLGLQEEELEVIEQYLKEEAGQETLDKLSRQSAVKFGGTAIKSFDKLQDSLLLSKDYSMLGKIITLLFSLGAEDLLQNLFHLLRREEIRKQIQVQSELLTAIFVREVIKFRHYFHSSWLRELTAIAGHSTVVLKGALSYCREDACLPKILLLTAYFWEKYPDTPQRSLLSSIKELAAFWKKGQEHALVAVAREDAACMVELEDLLLQNMPHAFAQNSNPIACRELLGKAIAAIGSNTLSEELLVQLGGVGAFRVEEQVHKILLSCAYINYMLSGKLKNMVTVYAVTNPEAALRVIPEADCRSKLLKNGAEFDRLFCFPPEKLIAWAAELKPHQYGYHRDLQETVLKEQFERNRLAYLKSFKEAKLDVGTVMLEIIRQEDSKLYERLLSNGQAEQKEKTIQIMVKRCPLPQEVSEYLRGEKELSDLYAIESVIAENKKSFWGYEEEDALRLYQNIYDDPEFVKRVLVYMAVAGSGYFGRYFCNDRAEGTGINPERVKLLFASLQEGGLDVTHQLGMLSGIMDCLYLEKEKKQVETTAHMIFGEYLKKNPEETKQGFGKADAYGRYFALCIMEKEAECYRDEILSYAQDSAKLVREKLEQILQGRQQWRTQVQELLKAKRAAQRELAIRVMAYWNTPEDKEMLSALLQTEKNAKISKLLSSVLQNEDNRAAASADTRVLTCEEMVDALHKGGKSRTLAWAYETPFSAVYKKNGEEASEKYLQAILLAYMGMSTPGISRDAQVLVAGLEEAQWAVYVNELFDKWLEKGAEAKKRWVMYVASIHGGGEIVQKLYHQIQEWPNMARGAIAAEAVKALALNPRPEALLFVDSIARKFKFKQVKTAAGSALEFAASQLGITREELEDRIVPDLGFDEKRERRFDYGERSFLVSITSSLELEVFEEKGKKLKNLPAPGKKDDEEKAKAAYAEFKEMKKQLKATVASQKMRLEQALSAQRLWELSAWKALFVKNPIMHVFAIGLIWGIYEENKLVQTFRYMEDGSFNTEDEEEYLLPKEGFIGLVHPIELSGESREEWKQQLEDYEIQQPIEQLHRTIYYRTAQEEESKTLDRFGGMKINSMSLSGKLQQLGWYRGSVQDAGCFDTFYREDTGLMLGVELHFSGTYVGSYDGGEEVMVYDARFYKAGTIQRGSYRYEEADEQKQIPLKEIPDRYFSEIVLQLTKATASSQEREENWRENKD